MFDLFDLGIASLGFPNSVIFRCGCERNYMETWQAQRFNPTKLFLCFDHTKLYERYLCEMADKPPPLTRLRRHTAMDR